MADVCLTLDGNADAVEFCPDPRFCSVLAAATYTLQEKNNSESEINGPSRLGILNLFSISSQQQGGDLELQQLQKLSTSGIFDIKWRPICEDNPMLAQASADGSISLYGIDVHNDIHLSELQKEKLNSSMCLSLDWDPHSFKQIAISHSDGSISVVDVQESGIEVCQTHTNAHNFEAWYVAYDIWRPGIVYSGGDDCQFCCWDLRQDLSSSVFRNKKTHQMGVCSVQASPYKEYLLATGSYDEHLRLWDIRMLEKPVLSKVLGLGGGVWRIKWHPFHKAYLAAACMHNGFSVVKLHDDDDISVIKEYKKHESLAYGVDWLKGPLYGINNTSSVEENTFQESVLASCSFYDRCLRIWRPNLDL